MKLKFKGKSHLMEYHRPGVVDFIDGEEKEVADDIARDLLKDFPGMFIAVFHVPVRETKEISRPPVHRMIDPKNVRTRTVKK